MAGRVLEWCNEISIHSPYTGRDCDPGNCGKTGELFQSTLPIQGETVMNHIYYPKNWISIHSPYTGRDPAEATVREIRDAISIHSPYTGRDSTLRREITRYRNFNPLSLYRERRYRNRRWHIKSIYFNPLSLYRERQNTCPCPYTVTVFQSTLPIQGETIWKYSGN